MGCRDIFYFLCRTCGCEFKGFEKFCEDNFILPDWVGGIILVLSVPAIVITVQINILIRSSDRCFFFKTILSDWHCIDRYFFLDLHLRSTTKFYFTIPLSIEGVEDLPQYANTGEIFNSGTMSDYFIEDWKIEM